MLMVCHYILSLSLFCQNEFYYDFIFLFFLVQALPKLCGTSLGTFPIHSVSVV